MTAMYDEMRRRLENGDDVVVATIVHTRGSTPREVGTRMLIGADGRIEGTVGGGCGEAEVWSEAMEVLESRTPKLIEVDLLHDHDAEGGRACGGLMYVFIEPLVRRREDRASPDDGPSSTARAPQDNITTSP